MVLMGLLIGVAYASGNTSAVYFHCAVKSSNDGHPHAVYNHLMFSKKMYRT